MTTTPELMSMRTTRAVTVAVKKNAMAVLTKTLALKAKASPKDRPLRGGRSPALQPHCSLVSVFSTSPPSRSAKSWLITTVS